MAIVQIDGKSILLRELTVADIRNWLAALAVADDAPVDLADVLLFEDAGLRVGDFARLTNLSPEAIAALTPAALEQVLAKSREVNPRFFLALGRVLALGRMSIQQRPSPTSSAPARSSPGWFTRMFTPGHGAG